MDTLMDPYAHIALTTRSCLADWHAGQLTMGKIRRNVPAVDRNAPTITLPTAVVSRRHDWPHPCSANANLC